MNPKMTALDAALLMNKTVSYVKSKIVNNKNAAQIQTSKALANRIYFGHESAREIFNLSFSKKIQVISVQIVKGGPGKTSITKNLGIRAALYGARVLLVDLDQQGNLTSDLMDTADTSPIMMDLISDADMPITDAINPIFPGLDLIASRLENSALDNTLTLEHHPLDRVLKDRLDPLREKYDLILIDCPPAITASVAAAALASDLVLCPVGPEKYCLDGLKMSYAELLNLEKKFKRQIPLKVVMNKFDSRTYLSGEVLRALHTSPIFGPRLYKTFIRASQEFSNCTARRESIFDGQRVTSAQEDIDSLTREVLDLNAQLNAQSPPVARPLSDKPCVARLQEASI